MLGLMAWGLLFCAVALTAANADTQPMVLNHSGIYGLRDADATLNGAGVKIALICRSMTYNTDGEPQYDYRPNIEHDCFAGKQISFVDDSGQQPGISPHSTAICSILFGQDADGYYPQVGPFKFEGIAPAAEADVYEFWYFLFNNVLCGVPPDADVVTASMGSQSEDWWTRGIESLVEQYGLVIVAGIGNGLDADDPLLYPGASANVIGVGVVDSVDSDDPAVNLSRLALAYPDHSSFGPTADGRCKPDLVAPGNCLAANANEPNGYEATGSWSSFSTPIVAGTVGLLVQKAARDPNLSSALSIRGGNCVIKSILMNSATKLPYWHKGRLTTDDDHQAPLDCVQGAGMLNATGAFRHLTAGENNPGDVPTTGWDMGHLDENRPASNVYTINLEKPADKLITITTAWNKHYDSNYPFEAMPEEDTNLRLELWAVNANDPNKDYLLDYSDSSTDNVEHIHCRADANYTNYEIVVSHAKAVDPNRAGQLQTYGLAWNVGEQPQGKSFAWYDLNADGIVNKDDLGVFVDNVWAGTEPAETYLFGDINGDGKIDEQDLDDLSKHLNETADWRTR
jgi:hypothetical protein